MQTTHFILVNLTCPTADLRVIPPNRFEQKQFPAIFAFRTTKELCVLRFNVYVLIIYAVFNVLIHRDHVLL